MRGKGLIAVLQKQFGKAGYPVEHGTHGRQLIAGAAHIRLQCSTKASVLRMRPDQPSRD